MYNLRVLGRLWARLMGGWVGFAIDIIERDGMVVLTGDGLGILLFCVNIDMD